jgi:hypothetical protein
VSWERGGRMGARARPLGRSIWALDWRLDAGTQVVRVGWVAATRRLEPGGQSEWAWPSGPVYPFMSILLGQI